MSPEPEEKTVVYEFICSDCGEEWTCYYYKTKGADARCPACGLIESIPVMACRGFARREKEDDSQSTTANNDKMSNL